MTEAFAELVTPILRYVVSLQQGFERGEHPSLEAVRSQTLAHLNEAAQKAASSTQLTHDFALARAGLVYWIDEVLITSGWDHAEEWKQQILEQSLFQERNRADRFFERAREAEALAGTDPLEVFFLAAALGFRGRYAFQPEELKSWAEKAYDRIAAGSRQTERFLPDEPRDEAGRSLSPLPGKTLLWVVSLLVSITAIVTLICFLLAIHLSL